jgi:hypothetical protein
LLFRYDYAIASVDLPELPDAMIRQCAKLLPGISLRRYQSQAIQWMVIFAIVLFSIKKITTFHLGFSRA